MQLCQLTVHQLMDLLKSRDTSAFEVAQAYARRIGEVEDQVKAFITRTEDLALEQARFCDEKGSFSGLYSVPYGLKDIFCTRGVKTTAGSRILENSSRPMMPPSPGLLKMRASASWAS